MGLEAQQEAIRLFSQLEGYQITAHFTEVESGKKDNRPELLLAKLDRLSRNVAFIQT